MGRTVYYKTNGRTTKNEDVPLKIMKIERKYNRNYRWRGEKLSLSRGFTKTYDSDKDVCRVIMAIVEISMKDDVVWRIKDDGGIINGTIKNGIVTGKIDLGKWMNCRERSNISAWTTNKSKEK